MANFFKQISDSDDADKIAEELSIVDIQESYTAIDDPSRRMEPMEARKKQEVVRRHIDRQARRYCLRP